MQNGTQSFEFFLIFNSNHNQFTRCLKTLITLYREVKLCTIFCSKNSVQ